MIGWAVEKARRAPKNVPEKFFLKKNRFFYIKNRFKTLQVAKSVVNYIKGYLG